MGEERCCIKARGGGAIGVSGRKCHIRINSVNFRRNLCFFIVNLPLAILSSTYSKQSRTEHARRHTLVSQLNIRLRLQNEARQVSRIVFVKRTLEVIPTFYLLQPVPSVTLLGKA